MTKNNEKEKNKKVPFAVFRKGVVGLALAGVMALSPIMLAGCSNGQDGKDGINGLDGAKWYSGIDCSIDSNATNAKVGDFYIDTDDYILYQKQADGTWTILMQNFGKPGQDSTAPTITINNDGYWVINGVPTDTKAQGNPGSDGTTPTISISDEGYWVINGIPTNVKAEAIDGTNGKDGNTWTVGTEYPSTPKNGDIFLNNSTWEVYLYNGTIWESKGNVKGQNGISSYTHIRYATDILGANMTNTWQVGYNYIGIAITNSNVAPSDADSYQWALFTNSSNENSENVSKELNVSNLTWAEDSCFNDDNGSVMKSIVTNTRVAMTDFICVQPGDTISLNSENYKFIMYAYSSPNESSFLTYMDTNLEDDSSALKNWGNTFEFKSDTKLSSGTQVNYPLYVRITVRANDSTNATTLTVNDVKDLFTFNVSADNSHLNSSTSTGESSTSVERKIAPEFYNTNIIAHRGLTTSAPENTMSAVKEAYKAGIKIVEVDVQMTKDNIPVLLHDSTIDRTSTGSGNISALTLEEARQYTYGYGKSEYADEQLPTLQEYLAYCKTRNILCELDLANRGFTSTQKKVIYDLVESMGMLDKTMFTATSSELLGYISFNKNIIVSVSGITSTSIAKTTLTAFKNCSMVFASVPAANMTQELVSYIHSLGMKVKVWTIDNSDTTQLQNALNWGVDMIMSNDMTTLISEE